MTLPDFPGFPSLQLEHGRARLYRVHGAITLLAVAANVPPMGEVILYAFCERQRLGDRAWITRDVQEVLEKLTFFRAGMDPLARDYLERPSREEVPDIRPLYERGFAYAIDAGRFDKPGGGQVIPFPEQ